MSYDPDERNRRSIRLPQYDYTASGAYFVTVCVEGRSSLLGKVNDGRINLSQIGLTVEKAWQSISERFPDVNVDWYVIMPNHFHGIVSIDANGKLRDRKEEDSSVSLASVMRAFKSISAREANLLLGIEGKRFWQRNYYERVIRDEEELCQLRTYITNNPSAWDDDEHNPMRRKTSKG